MSRHEAPAYFCVTGDVGRNPAPESCVEGRLFLDDDRLRCGAGDPTMQGGYVGRIDDHAGSTVRRLFGGIKGFQEFDAADAAGRERTRSLALDAVTDVSLVEWAGSDLKGADRTYAVRVDSRELAGESLLIQLGRGWRNRGAGRKRHATLSRLVDAMSGDAASSDAVPGDIEGDAAVDDAPADETGETELIARNDTGSPVSARIGCRVEGDTEFAEDVTIPSRERERWTDLPENRTFEIGVSLDGGDNALAEFDGTESVEGDVHVYLAPEEVVVDTSKASVASDTDTGSREASAGREGTAARADRRGTADDGEPKSVDSGVTASDGSRVNSLGIAFLGVVVWFGSALLQPSVALPGRGVPYSADPSLVQTLETAQAVVAFAGVIVLLYGLYSLVTGGR